MFVFVHAAVQSVSFRSLDLRESQDYTAWGGRPMDPEQMKRADVDESFLQRTASKSLWFMLNIYSVRALRNLLRACATELTPCVRSTTFTRCVRYETFTQCVRYETYSVRTLRNIYSVRTLQQNLGGEGGAWELIDKVLDGLLLGTYATTRL